MQSNDLNHLLSSYEGLSFEDCLSKNIMVSEFSPCGKLPTKKELKETKTPISEQMMIEVRETVSYYENLGKSRRWIRRYIKRKFNITEY
ncbi:hypothetical protein PFY12_14635 [Chryseobacterium camelliae]|uniref:Transposase n=1 Tax=Chryseobacterium camelliae TaxID=1265445 RepID=A0ABY7QKV2_9FLAO|nr:hypothetical protein [Chryseobacterium camelliae]WBV60262.1 hypothetical protein PFY12_14635 [Chryseobacterium camelliae]